MARHDLILGTAGHIDHGKTSLVKALTGSDTDRLPEEKKRGITIDLGFAYMELPPYRIGIVDVPGHERFVRNMLAGATGIDMALLVIAADDSVKPQTREHLEILKLLDLRLGIIAITKTDVVEPDWLDLVEEEIRDLVSDTFLAGAPIVRTSAMTGEGIADLKQIIEELAGQVSASVGDNEPFRLAIDRTFTIAGHGTVVTGSVLSGSCKIGDELIIEPGGREVRIRGLQNHDSSVDEVREGQRAAINLSGVHHNETERGQELTSPGHLRPSRRLTARIHLLPEARHAIKDRDRVRLHIGTAEVLATVRLLEGSQLDAGQETLAQLVLSKPVVSVWHQPFVLRQQSPVVTIGGGHVLEPDAAQLRKLVENDLDFVRQLQSQDELDRASAALYLAGLRVWEPHELARTAGIRDPERLYKQLLEANLAREIRVSPTRSMKVHEKSLIQLASHIDNRLRMMHERAPLKPSLPVTQLRHAFRHVEVDQVLDSVLKDLAKEKRIRLKGDRVALKGHGPQLSANEQKLLDVLIQQYRDAGLTPKTVKQYQSSAAKLQSSVPQLIEVAAAEESLVKLNDELYLHQATVDQIKQTLRIKMGEPRGYTLSEIRDLLDTTRKFAVPLCEYLDKSGFTIRDGDTRILAPNVEETSNRTV